jgi:hypothetical protein
VVGSTVAIAALMLLQVPPVVLGVKVMLAPTQTEVGPEIVPADGIGLTVIEVVVEKPVVVVVVEQL